MDGKEANDAVNPLSTMILHKNEDPFDERRDIKPAFVNII